MFENNAKVFVVTIYVLVVTILTAIVESRRSRIQHKSPQVYRLHRGVTEKIGLLLAEAYHVGYGVHFRALQSDMEFAGGQTPKGFSIGGASAVDPPANGRHGMAVSGALSAEKKAVSKSFLN